MPQSDLQLQLNPYQNYPEKEAQSLKTYTPWFQNLMQSNNNQDTVVLAQD